MNRIAERQGDFIGQIIRLINEGNKAQAVEKILVLPDNEKLEVITALATKTHNTEALRLHITMTEIYSVMSKFDRYLDRNPARDRTLALDLALTLTRALDLTRDLDFHLDFDLNRDRDRDRGSNFNNPRESASALARALARDHDLDRDLARASALARALTRDHANASASASDRLREQSILVSSINQFIHIVHVIILLVSEGFLSRAILENASTTYSQKLADALDEALYLHQEEASNILDVVIQIIEKMLESDLRHITLEGIDRITPDTNGNQIAPYLQALNDFLRIEAEITNKPVNELRIVQMHNEASKFELVGLGDFVRALIELFQFRKRKDEARSREIEIEKKQLENEVFKKETEQKIAQIELEKANLEAAARAHLIEIEANALKSQIEARQALLELAQKEQEFLRQKYKGYIEEAAQYIERKMPHLTIEARLPYIARLALTYQQMDDTGLTGRFGSHDVPRPPSLPK